LVKGGGGREGVFNKRSFATLNIANGSSPGDHCNGSSVQVQSFAGSLPNGRWWNLYQGDCRSALKLIEESSVNCIITSPPYYWQRDYGVPSQIGHESTVQAFVDAIVACFREMRRVLKDDGVVFLNLGDTYYSAKGKPHGTDRKSRGRQLSRVKLRAVDGPGLGLPRKTLIGIPWRVAIALQAEKWTLRSDVVWKRPGALPEPTAHDRPWLTHEHVFILAKKPRYWFNRKAIAGEEDIWQIPPRPDSPGAHFAPFPSALVEKCINCGCPEGGTVLDPFVGSGTTMVVAARQGRNSIGIELNPRYCDFIRERFDRLAADIASGNGKISVSGLPVFLDSRP
jgi:DNA modification methylase